MYPNDNHSTTLKANIYEVQNSVHCLLVSRLHGGDFFFFVSLSVCVCLRGDLTRRLPVHPRQHSEVSDHSEPAEQKARIQLRILLVHIVNHIKHVAEDTREIREEKE